MIGDYLKAYNYDYLLKQGLNDIPNTIDKRQGAVVYDAVASTARMLAEAYGQMQQVYSDTFAQYSLGEALQLRALENGVEPKKAVKAIRKGLFTGNDDLPYNVPIGARFSVIDGGSSINYTVIERIDTGVYALRAEIAGTVGNDYLGHILPIDVLYNLKSAELADIIIPGSGDEEDESLRVRYFEEKNAKRFGGNVVQYRGWITELDGVGACQIYPVWDGGGTVKIAVIDSQYHSLTAELLNQVQQAIDPTQDGQGVGTAPIGHIVTVVTPDILSIDISAAIQVAAGYSIEQLKPLIEAEVTSYIDEVKRDWGTPASAEGNDYSLYIFVSQVAAAILRTRGVMNVTDLTLNSQTGDIRLVETAALQQLPVLGAVNIV